MMAYLSRKCLGLEGSISAGSGMRDHLLSSGAKTSACDGNGKGLAAGSQTRQRHAAKRGGGRRPRQRTPPGGSAVEMLGDIEARHVPRQRRARIAQTVEFGLRQPVEFFIGDRGTVIGAAGREPCLNPAEDERERWKHGLSARAFGSKRSFLAIHGIPLRGWLKPQDPLEQVTFAGRRRAHACPHSLRVRGFGRRRGIRTAGVAIFFRGVGWPKHKGFPERGKKPDADTKLRHPPSSRVWGTRVDLCRRRPADGRTLSFWAQKELRRLRCDRGPPAGPWPRCWDSRLASLSRRSPELSAPCPSFPRFPVPAVAREARLRARERGAGSPLKPV